MDSTVTVVGNMTRDPELRFTPGGLAVASFGVVYNKWKRNDDGTYEDGDPQFFDVTCWSTLAQHVAESLEKGSRVVVFGRPEYREWTNKDGDKRSKVQIVADAVGPDLKWATASVEKVSRSDESVAASNAKTVQAAFDPGEEPF